MRYKYFIAISHNRGFGRYTVESKHKIKSLDDIKKIENEIEDNFDVNDVLIINYRLI